MSNFNSFGARFGRLVAQVRGDLGVTQDDLADQVFGSKTRKPDISRLENAQIGNPHQKTIKAICGALGINEAELEALRTASPVEASLITHKLENALKDNTNMARALERSQFAPFDQLVALAARFGEEDPAGKTETSLREFLASKAQDLERLAREVEAMRGLSARIDNIRAAATDAIRQGNLAEARNLLGDARAVQADLLRAPLEANAVLMERTAEIDLLEGKVKAAYTAFTAAANSFAAVDPLEPARRKLRYEDQLFQHGHRYGGTGLSLSEKMIRAALSDDLRTQDVRLWAYGQNALAVALSVQGNRSEGASGAALLGQAVEAYHAALQVHSRTEHPVDWAGTQNNLANARSDQADQANRSEGEAGATLFGQAVDAYRAALQVYTFASYPVDWAMTQNNLAIALKNQANRSEGEAEAGLLRQAVEACREALKIRTRADHPLAWAATQNNLASALWAQANCSDGQTRATLLRQAVRAFRLALQVRTRADHPVAWAMTQNNLATVLWAQASHSEGEAGAALLAHAVEAYHAALQVHTRAEHPVTWAMTQENMAIAEFDIARHPSTKTPEVHLAAALVHVDAALTIFDPIHMSQQHTKATTVRKLILAALQRTTP